MIRHNRLLVAFHVVSDAMLGLAAFILAYLIRFHTGLIPITRGLPPLRQYLNVLPFIAVVVPLGFYLQGLYRLRRGRSRVDDFFAVFVGSILAVVFGVVGTLYVQSYVASDAARSIGAYQVSQLVWAVFITINVGLTYSSRELMREILERRWRAGIGLKRILIAGSGDLGRLVADKILEHRELGYQIVGFVDDRASGFWRLLACGRYPESALDIGLYACPSFAAVPRSGPSRSRTIPIAVVEPQHAAVAKTTY